MYNPNYDFIVYNAFIFTYLPNGELITIPKIESFRAEPLMQQLVALLFFLAFYCYFTLKFLLELCRAFQESGKK